MTVLYKGKSTTRHSHIDTEEIYLVVKGKGGIQLGEEGKEEVVSGDIVVIPRGVFTEFSTKVRVISSLFAFLKNIPAGGNGII